MSDIKTTKVSLLHSIFPFKMSTSVKIESIVFGVLFLGFYYKPSFTFILVQIIVASAMVVGLYQKNTNLFCKSKKTLLGRTVLVSGGTTGMGLEIASDMAHRGARVIITCPFLEEGLEAKKRIERSSGSDKVIFKLLDLSSFESVRRFALDIMNTEERLDIVVNNAGIGVPPERLTVDGLHIVMQVNYFGTVLLTVLLLPLLKKTGQPSEPSRIVNTASVLHRIGEVDYDNWNKIGYWNKSKLYGNSKLCLVMFTRELSMRLKGTNVTVNVVDPGAVGTAIFKSGGDLLGGFLAYLITILFKNPWEGAQTALYASLSDRAGKVSGKYFKNCQIALPGKAVYDDHIASRLWDETIKVLKLKDEDWNNNCPSTPSNGVLH